MDSSSSEAKRKSIFGDASQKRWFKLLAQRLTGVAQKLKRERLQERFNWQKLLIAVVVSFFIFIMLTPPTLFLSTRYVIGDVFERDIYAWRSVEYISPSETRRAMEEAIKSVEPVYRPVHEATERVLYSIQLIYRHLRSIAVSGGSLHEKVQEAKSKLPMQIDESTLKVCLSVPSDVLKLMESWTLSLAQKELDKGIKPTADGLRKAKESIIKNSKLLPMKPVCRDAVAKIAIAVLEPNLIYDAKATQQLRDKLVKTISPVRKRLNAGELVARSGQVASEEDIEKLKALGINYVYLMAALILAVVLTCLAGFSVERLLHVRDDKRLSHLTLLSLIWVSALFIHYLLSLAGIYEGVFIFLSTAAMVTCILFDSPLLAIVLSGFASFLVGVMALCDPSSLILHSPLRSLVSHSSGFSAVGYAVKLACTSFICSAVGVYSTASINQRSQLVRAGVLIGFIAFVCGVSLSILLGPLSVLLPMSVLMSFIWHEALVSAIAGVATPALTLAMVAMLERSFGMVTPFTLLELANSSTGLLRHLSEVAPGTYQSSLMVASLARIAAEAIGANPMLAYVGGLYHDIGKLKRPHYFSENQRGRNPHDELSPSLSARILQEHVEEGVRLAKEHRLPKCIIDFISEHHGTSLMRFFYSEALSQDKLGDSVPEEIYRYQGPKPRSKETALVMLADAVEAAVSSLPDELFKTQDGWKTVEKTIDRVIDEKVEDGQLDESPISYKDLKIIREVFKRQLRVSRLQRVQYPIGVVNHRNNKRQTEKSAA
ncbi:MAG: hypothetical protein HZRFUVUK_000485 [Candidatus Fervidibacterota bacterium]|jgi:putative nucleotidyltransferase with HDIG domain